MVEATSPSKLRILHPNLKLKPPDAVLKLAKIKQRTQLSKNKFINFFLIFFGEGF